MEQYSKCRSKFIWIALPLITAFLWLSGCSEGESIPENETEIAGVVAGAGTASAGTEEARMESIDHSGLYAYDLLDENGKAIYADIYSALAGRQAGRLPSDTAQEAIERIYRMVMADHPELFYVSGYDIQLSAQPLSAEGSKDSVVEPLDIYISFKGREVLSEEEILERKETLEALREDILAGLPEDAGEYEKARQLYEYVILHTVYGGNAVNGQTADSALLGGKAVCTGYARAAQYLLQGGGIPAVLVTGRRGGGNHAWLLVKLDGAYYYMDPTEGDSLLAGMPSNYRRIFVNYAYFAMTSAETASKYRNDGLLVLPECTETADSYFEREGRYIDAADESELQGILQLPEWTADSGFAYLQVRCAKECLEEVKAELAADEQVAEHGWSCVKNDESGVLTFYRPMSRTNR